jgi:hypothetical protein
MSTSAEQEITGLDNLLQEAEEIAPPENTMPSQEELSVQARLGRRLFGTHKQGKCCVTVRRVEDGYAYRLMGDHKEQPWRWMRTADFERHFECWREIRAGEVIIPSDTLLRTLSDLQYYGELLTIAEESMGKTSKARYDKETEKWKVEKDREAQDKADDKEPSRLTLTEIGSREQTRPGPKSTRDKIKKNR